MSKILVTGASGFVGHAVIKSLREQGHVICGTTRDETAKRGPENIPLYLVPKLDKDTDWDNVITGADVIIHLAARVHEMGNQTNSQQQEYITVNEEGTQKLALAAANAGVKRFVFISTIKVNGEKTYDCPFTENDEVNPNDLYSISKSNAEKSLLRIHKNTGLEVIILRVPLVYGPRVKGNFYSLLWACAKRKLLPLKSVKNFRSFLYVGNLSSAITKCVSEPDIETKIYLLSDGVDISTSKLVETISVFLGVRPRIFYIPIGLLFWLSRLFGKLEVVERLTGSLQVDSTLIREELDWSPPFTLEEGLERTVQWFNEHRRYDKN